jgi:hypothetical protein
MNSSGQQQKQHEERAGRTTQTEQLNENVDLRVRTWEKASKNNCSLNALPWQILGSSTTSLSGVSLPALFKRVYRIIDRVSRGAALGKPGRLCLLSSG